MKKLVLTISALAMVAILGWSFGRPADAAGNDKQQITDLEHKLAASTSADEALKYYDPTDEVVVFDMAGPPREYKGQKAVRGDFEKAFAGLKNVKVDFIELNVVTDGKLGFASSIQRFTATGPDGKPMDVTFRQTDCLHKVDGQWKILHQHISLPVDMATGKADMASKM
jgi:ketosteroid isomerase-like protein